MLRIVFRRVLNQEAGLAGHLVEVEVIVTIVMNFLSCASVKGRLACYLVHTDYHVYSKLAVFAGSHSMRDLWLAFHL